MRDERWGRGGGRGRGGEMQESGGVRDERWGRGRRGEGEGDMGVRCRKVGGEG